MNKTEIVILILGLLLCFLVGSILLYLIVKHYKNTKTQVKLGVLDKEMMKEYKGTHSKASKVRGIVGNVFEVIFTVIFLGCLAFGIYSKANNDFFALNDTNVLIIKSNSMAKKFEKNQYLFDNHLDDQFSAFDMIVIHEKPAETEIKKYDVVAYDYEGTLIVHRIIDIKDDTSNPGHFKFTTQGDANPSKDPITVRYKDIVGIFSSVENGLKGTSIIFVGYLVYFFQSPLGYLGLIIFAAYVILMPGVEKRLDKVRDARLLAIGFIDENMKVNESFVYDTRLLSLRNKERLVGVYGEMGEELSENSFTETVDDVTKETTEYKHYQRLLLGDKKKLEIDRMSFLAKLDKYRELDPDYVEIADVFKSYGLKSRISFGGDSYRLHKKLYGVISIRGRHLNVDFAIRPEDIENKNVPIIDLSIKKKKILTPSRLKITSGLEKRRAIEIIEYMCEMDGLRQPVLNVIEEVAEPIAEEVAPVVVEPLQVEPAKFSLDIKRMTFLEKLEKYPELSSDYQVLKDELESYTLNSRLSSGGDSFRLHRKLYSKIEIHGKHLCVYLAINPKAFEDSPIPIIDLSGKPAKADVPSCLKITSPLALRRALQLIDEMCEANGLVKMIPDDVVVKNDKPEEIDPKVEEVAEVNETPIVADGPAKFTLDIKKMTFLEKLEKYPELSSDYQILKDELESYGLNSRLSSSGDSFRLHKKLYTRISIHGKHLYVYLALDPKEFEDSSIPIIDLSEKPSKAETPSCLKITSPLALRRAIQLIGNICNADGLTKKN